MVSSSERQLTGFANCLTYCSRPVKEELTALSAAGQHSCVGTQLSSTSVRLCDLRTQTNVRTKRSGWRARWGSGAGETLELWQRMWTGEKDMQRGGDIGDQSHRGEGTRVRMGAVVPADGHTAGVWASLTQGPRLKVTHSREMGDGRGPEPGTIQGSGKADKGDTCFHGCRHCNKILPGFSSELRHSPAVTWVKSQNFPGPCFTHMKWGQ